MTELTIQPDEIRNAIQRNVAAFETGNTRDEVGRVLETGDGIARVEGLHSAMTNELLEFKGGLLGIALNLDVREIGAVLLGDGSKIEEGQEVRRTGEVLSVPVGDGFLGRVVNPLGEPIDGLGEIATDEPPRTRGAGAHGRAAPAGQGAHAHRYQGHRRHDRHRSRTAPVDHRRPPDR